MPDHPLSPYLPCLVIDTARHRKALTTAASTAPAAPAVSPAGEGPTAPMPSAPHSGVALLYASQPTLAPTTCLLSPPNLQVDLEPAADDLTAAIDRLTRRHRLAPDALRAVAVNQGPGSWTGLRISVTAAKTLAAALPGQELPLLALDSLFIQALSFVAAHVSPEKLAGRTLLVLQDSGHGQLTSAQYRCPPAPVPGWPAEAVPPQMHAIEALSETFARGPGILLGMDTFPPKLLAQFHARFPSLPADWKVAETPHGPAATAMAAQAVLRAAVNLAPFNDGPAPDPVTAAAAKRLILSPAQIHPLAPLYLKDPYAP